MSEIIGVNVGMMAKIKQGSCAGLCGRVVSYDVEKNIIKLDIDSFTTIYTDRDNIRQGGVEPDKQMLLYMISRLESEINFDIRNESIRKMLIQRCSEIAALINTSE